MNIMRFAQFYKLARPVERMVDIMTKVENYENVSLKAEEIRDYLLQKYDYYVRCPGGSRVGHDKYVNPTKELKEYIKSRYGLDVWNY